MRFRLVLSIVGFMGMICGFSMMIPALVDLLCGVFDAATRFSISSSISVAISLLIYLCAGTHKEPLRVKEMFLTTTLVWIISILLSALPFFLSTYTISWSDSVFEATSGLTTTGSTILSGLDHLSPGLLLWRSMLQWIGGAGILVLAITILPTLHIGGMQFFNTESSAQSERDLPTVVQNMQALFIYFICLTVACAVSLKMAGMSSFDAVNHAMTTISTGGFSTHDASIAYYRSPTIEWILIVFMGISGLPLILGLHLAKQKWQAIKNDAQIFFYLKFILGSTIILCLLRWINNHFLPTQLWKHVRESIFSIVSVMTSTGFVADNYQAWGSFAIAFFMFLLVVGGCTGSTAGGIKMFRFKILTQSINVRLRSLVQPHGVFVPRYGNHTISDDVLISVLVFIGLYLTTAVVITLLLSIYGFDFITSFSASLSSLSNVGPGLGNLIGPDQTFSSFPDQVKWILSIAMLIGRLEFVSVFVLFFPFIWRKNA